MVDPVTPTPTVCCGCDIFKTNKVLIGIEVVLCILAMVSVFGGSLGYLRHSEGTKGFLSLIVLGVELYGTIKMKRGFIMVACGWRIFRILIHIIILIFLALAWSGSLPGFDIFGNKESLSQVQM